MDQGILSVLRHLAVGLKHISIPLILLLVQRIRAIHVVLWWGDNHVEWRDQSVARNAAGISDIPLAAARNPYHFFRWDTGATLARIDIHYVIIVKLTRIAGVHYTVRNHVLQAFELRAEARRLTEEKVGDIDAPSLKADVLYPLQERDIHMLRPDQLEEGLLNVNPADHCLIRPDRLFTPGCVVPEAHSHCPPLAYDDLVHRAAGAKYRPMSYSAADNGVEIAMHPSTRRCRSGVAQGYCSAEGWDGHTLPLRAGP